MAAARCVILCRLPASTATAAIVEACEALGLPVALRRPAEAGTLAAEAAGAAVLAGGDGAGRTERPLLVTRLPSGTPSESLWPLLALESAGWRFVDAPSALAVAHAKPLALARLAEAGLPVPPTVCVLRDAPVLLDGLPGERFVVKPATGGSGRGVLTGLTRGQAARAAHAFADASGPALVQPLLGEGLDRRLLVVGGAVVAAMERLPRAGDGRGNLAYGARAAPFTPGEDRVRLALAAATALRLDVAAVDLLDDGGRDVVLEVNACPGLRGISSATGIDAAGAIASLLAGLAPP